MIEPQVWLFPFVAGAAVWLFVRICTGCASGLGDTPPNMKKEPHDAAPVPMIKAIMNWWAKSWTLPLHERTARSFLIPAAGHPFVPLEPPTSEGAKLFRAKYDYLRSNAAFYRAMQLSLGVLAGKVEWRIWDCGCQATRDARASVWVVWTCLLHPLFCPAWKPNPWGTP